MSHQIVRILHKSELLGRIIRLVGKQLGLFIQSLVQQANIREQEWHIQGTQCLQLSAFYWSSSSTSKPARQDHQPISLCTTRETVISLHLSFSISLSWLAVRQQLSGLAEPTMSCPEDSPRLESKLAIVPLAMASQLPPQCLP